MATNFKHLLGAGLISFACFSLNAVAQQDEVLPPDEFEPSVPAQTSDQSGDQENTADEGNTESDDTEDGQQSDSSAESSAEDSGDDTPETGTDTSDSEGDSEDVSDGEESLPIDDNPPETVQTTETPAAPGSTSEDSPSSNPTEQDQSEEMTEADDAAVEPGSSTDLTPTLVRLTDHTITVGETLEFIVSASLANGDIPGIFATQLPEAATLTDNLDGTRLFRINANDTNIGSNTVTFVAFNEANPVLLDETSITITVEASATSSNPPPTSESDPTPGDTAGGLTIEPVPAQNVNVGQQISVRVRPVEPNGPVPNLFALNLPEGASLDDNFDGTRTFNWKPMDGDSGVYMVDLVAENPDNNDIRATAKLVVTVLSNTVPLIEIPQIEPLNDHRVQVNTMMILRVTPIGVNNVVPDLNVSPLPVNASFDDNGDGTRTLRWRPTPGAEGTYTITFIATDPVDRNLVGERSIQVEVVSDGSIPTTDEITEPVPQPDASNASPTEPQDESNDSSQNDSQNDSESQTDEPGTPDNTGPVASDDPAADESNSNTDEPAAEQPPVTMTREEFAAALPGSRYDECRITVPGAESERTVETFTDELYILDYYFFRNVDCSGIPFGSSNPLLIYGYTLGDAVITDDGRQAFEIDLQVEQTGSIGGDEFGEPEGSRAYDIIAKEGNSVLFAEAIASTTPETRPTLLQTAFPAENRPLLGKPDITPTDLAGNWASNCLNNQTVLYAFSDNTLVQNNITWDNATCDGGVHHNLETTYSISFGDSSRSLFGDYILPIDIEISASQYLQKDDSAGAPAAPPLPPIGMKSYQIVTLEQETLMFGTCSFTGGCLETEATRPDMVHLNNGRRWQRAP